MIIKRRLLVILAAGSATAISLYALVGFFLVPYFAQAQLWPRLSTQLGGQFQAERIAFNPFTFSVTVSGFSLINPEGQELTRIAETRLDLNAWASLENQALVVSGKIIQPSVTMLYDKQGKPNFGFLIPPAAPQDSPPSDVSPFLLTELTIDQGRVSFEDQYRGKGFKKVLSPLAFSLTNFGPKATGPAHYNLKTLAENQEVLEAEGDLQWLETALDGEFKLQGLQLAPLADWLASDLPYTVSRGTLTLALKYRYSPRLDFEIPTVEAQAKQFSMTQDGKPFLESDSITAKDLSFQLKTRRLTLQSVEATALKLNQADQPWLEASNLSAQQLSFATADGRLALERLKIAGIGLKTAEPVLGDDGKPSRFGVDSVEFGGVEVDTVRQSVNVSMILASHSVLSAWLNRDGSPGFVGMPKIQATSTAKPNDTKAESKPWQVKLGRVELNDNNLVLRDFSQEPPTSIRFAPLNLLVKDFDTSAPQPFWLGMNTGLTANGRIALEGQIKLSPLTLGLKMYVDDLSLPPFQSYLDKAVRIRIVKGALNMNADIDYDDSQNHKLRIGGDVAIANFASDDKQENREFVNWKGLRLNGLIFETAPQRLSIRDITLTEPYIRAFLDEHKKFNIAENLSPPSSAKSTTETKAKEIKPARLDKKTPAHVVSKTQAEPPLSVLIGAFNISQGNMDFADMTIKPINFSVDIHDLDGNIRSLSSRPEIKSDVLFTGKLNQGSTVKIFGKVSPFSPQAFTDITMDFNGVNLTTLTPYSAKFAGYRIEKGKLDMDLRYKLENGQVTAENKFVLNQLQLGERVDSPDATSLPVSLAISLLKDSAGKIDIDLPISGDLSNPDISIRSLLANAASSLLTKLVSSPFTILGNLLGSHGSEELQAVKFAPGEATFATQEKDELAVVAKILQDRPGLNLEIKGEANRQLDRQALVEQDINRQLKNAKLIELGGKKIKKAEEENITLSNEDYQRLFTHLYRWKSPNSPELQGLKAGEALSGNLLENAKRKLLEQWTVSEMDLRGLAQARSESIRSYLVKELGMSDQRIYLLDVKLSEQDAKEIKAMLSLSGS